jgi:hypothetical protein
MEIAILALVGLSPVCVALFAIWCFRAPETPRNMVNAEWRG